MRLLKREPNGELVLTDFTGKDVPPYAILSHTWAANSEEVSFQDVEEGKGKGKGKAGWQKIELCVGQATADGLSYVWIDTCCIDKRNAVELSRAINSMFRWYRDAQRCYVYLSDVSKRGDQDQNGPSSPAWEAAFRRSRWFTRGWTLQELIAPTLVKFYSLEGELIGSKSSLEEMIHVITGIPRNALRGDSLSNFSIDERFSWTEQRNTTLEEDKAYSLLGIFDVSMSLIYGEGREKAFARLSQKAHKSYKGPDYEQYSIQFSLSGFPESVQFFAREGELEEIRGLLSNGYNARSIVVLHGLGGMGKTQLAIAYTKRHKEKYTAIFWVNANDEDSLRLSFRAIAQRILKQHRSSSMLVGVDLDKDLDRVVDAVKSWLELPENTRWLMIFDNYDNPRIPGDANASAVDIRRFLPGSDHGSIILTTRSSKIGLGQPINVQKLPHVQGLKILSNLSGRKGIENDRSAIELVEELDGLPLALSTAGAYLEHVTTSFSEYLRLYKMSWLKLQTSSPQLTSYEDRSLYTTWQITFDRIEQESTAAAKLLKLWAYFDRQDIWFELLQKGRSINNGWLRALAEDELTFNKAIRLLCDYALVNANLDIQKLAGSSGYSLHSCVHTWSVFVLNQKWDENLARLAFCCVALEIPETHDARWWLSRRRIIHHVTHQERFIADGTVNTQGLGWALHAFGLHSFDRGKLEIAEDMYVRALQDKEKILGPKHTMTLNTVNGLGLLYEIQGKPVKAEEMFLRVLQDGEAEGPNHVPTLQTVANLGNHYMNQGKLAKAEELILRALRGFEEALGPKDTMTLDLIDSLGGLCKRQGKLEEAEKTTKRALQGKEETLGPQHLSTLDTLNNLAGIHIRQRRLIEAETMIRRALYGYEEALGPELLPTHISALNTVTNLGLLYSRTGRKDMARVMYERALSGFMIVRGSSSDVCRYLENRLKALDITQTASPMAQNPSTETRTRKSSPVTHKLMRQLKK